MPDLLLLRRITRLERRLAALAFVVLTAAVAAHRFWPALDEPLRVTISAFGDDGDGTDRLIPLDPWGRMVLPFPLRDEPPSARHLRAATYCLATARDLREARVDDAARYCAAIGEEHLRVARRLGADAAAIASAAGAERTRRGPFWMELGAWPDYSLGPDGQDELGGGDDVRLIRGQLRLGLYLALPSAGTSLALLLVCGLLAARAAPLTGRPLLELALAVPLALLALAGAALTRELLPLDPLEEVWGGRPEVEAVLGPWSVLLVPPSTALLVSVWVALWVLVALLRLRWDLTRQREALVSAGP